MHIFNDPLYLPQALGNGQLAYCESIYDTITYHKWTPNSFCKISLISAVVHPLAAKDDTKLFLASFTDIIVTVARNDVKCERTRANVKTRNANVNANANAQMSFSASVGSRGT